MSDRVEYWWVSHDTEIQPAEVTFRGGIPVRVRLIGTRDIVAAAAVELIERLPATPRPVLARPVAPPLPPPPRQSMSLLWLIGIVVLMLLYLFSGRLFDALQ